MPSLPVAARGMTTKAWALPRAAPGLRCNGIFANGVLTFKRTRSEEHTSELQSRGHLVCRLLLEKKKEERNVERTTQTAHAAMEHAAPRKGVDPEAAERCHGRRL